MLRVKAAGRLKPTLGRSLDETDDSEAIYQQEMAFFNVTPNE